MIIGQAPSSFQVEAALPLHGRCGEVLSYLAGLVSVEKLAEVFELRNVLDEYPGKAGKKGDKFPIALARERASMIAQELAGSNRRVVLLGRGVCRAFDRGDLEPFAWQRESFWGFWVAMIPHPSGVNLFWN